MGGRLCQALTGVIDCGGQPFQMLLHSQLAGWESWLHVHVATRGLNLSLSTPEAAGRPGTWRQGLVPISPCEAAVQLFSQILEFWPWVCLCDSTEKTGKEHHGDCQMLGVQHTHPT